MDTCIRFCQKNPKKMRTAARERYDKYCQARTKAEALELGATLHDLNHDFKLGFLTLEKLTSVPVVAIVPVQQGSLGQSLQQVPSNPGLATGPVKPTLSDDSSPQSTYRAPKRLRTKCTPVNPPCECRIQGLKGEDASASAANKAEENIGSFFEWARPHIYRCSDTVATETGDSVALRWASTALAFAWKLDSRVEVSNKSEKHIAVLAALMWTALSHEISYLMFDRHGKKSQEGLPGINIIEQQLRESLAKQMGCKASAVARAHPSVLSGLDFQGPRTVILDYLQDYLLTVSEPAVVV